MTAAAPPPIVRVAPAGPVKLVVAVRRLHGRHVEVALRRGALVVRFRRAARRFALPAVADSAYRIRVRSCRYRPQRSCSRWSPWRWTRTPRGVVVVGKRAPDATAPPMGALPALGFNDSAYADNRPSDFFADVHDLGGTIARRILVWPALEPDGPEPDTRTLAWRLLDRFVDGAAAHGLTVTFEVAAVPEWARDRPAADLAGGAPRIDAWHAFVALLADRVTPAGTRYDSVLRRFGWNEADCCSRSTYLPSPAQHAMLASVYRLLHDRGVEVMLNAGCPCGFADAGATQAQIIRYFGRAERGGGGRVFDSVSVHLYPSMFGRAHGWEPVSSPQALAYTTADMPRIVRELDADYDRRVDFHVTETGEMTAGGYHGDALSPDCQARFAIHTLDEARRYSSRLRSFEWFLIRDQPTAGTYMTGLRFADGTPKPLLGWWRSYVESPPATPVSQCNVETVAAP